MTENLNAQHRRSIRRVRKKAHAMYVASGGTYEEWAAARNKLADFAAEVIVRLPYGNERFLVSLEVSGDIILSKETVHRIFTGKAVTDPEGSTEIAVEFGDYTYFDSEVVWGNGFAGKFRLPIKPVPQEQSARIVPE